MADMIRLEVDEFRESWETWRNAKWPEAVARGFGALARMARDKMRDRTRQVFDLHTDYIPQAIRSTPDNSSQISAAARAFGKYGDLQASVYLRGGSGNKSMEFMLPHETGEDKVPQAGSLAIPSTDLEGYSFRTGRGATKRAWKPGKLLEIYNQTNHGKERRMEKRAGSVGAAFVMQTNKGPMVARRKGKDLQFLYSFKERADIKPVWDFEDTIVQYVNAHGRAIIERMIRASQ